MGAGGSCCDSTKPRRQGRGGRDKLPNPKNQGGKPQKYPKLEFDLVVPESTPGDATFDQSVLMYTMRDLGTANNTSAANFDGNLSFTNSVTEVNQTVLDQFTKSLGKLAKEGTFNNVLEESMMSRGGAVMADSVISSGSSSRYTPEDAQYVAEGRTLEEKLSRLGEVEEVSREQLQASEKVNRTLIQLGCARLIPTLRQRRHWTKEKAAAPKRDVVVISAPGVEAPSGTPTTPAPLDPDFSPRNLDTPQSPSGSLRLDRSMSLRNQPAKLEHYEMLTLTCMDIPVPCSSCHAKVENKTWDFLSLPEAANSLNAGMCMFRFMCSATDAIDEETQSLIDTFINVSSFKDEEKENNTPKVHIRDPAEASKYIAILVKAMYMLPGAKLSNITPLSVASLEYQKACQPGGPKVEAGDRDDTFRLTLNIIKFVFSLVIQFKVSEVTDPQLLQSFKGIDGMVPAKVLMLERTKRNVGKVDATAKVRSMLLYYPVNGGLLVNSQTIVLNTSLPKVVSKLVNTFGSQGASQSADTAKLTRNHLVKKYGDSRKQKK
ncbi:hypothetical protein AGDE_01548 [Angomonas deanei]|uniref:Uncharacterized protein n=1 Tax=Angomonas deanei TaxID=59799 RepID=A0A7G2CKI5_9TRYP|nr:hypothetical protein AGDE_01548 [Angomonas deanei]CAD2219441.1 hypothetical protein, conserved [Angomonas deanei]|eukprot:EPY42375.1 hypothetical protein AGDE_01548 [Angomonas deanei]